MKTTEVTSPFFDNQQSEENNNYQGFTSVQFDAENIMGESYTPHDHDDEFMVIRSTN